jgi:hypothetical protein
LKEKSAAGWILILANDAAKGKVRKTAASLRRTQACSRRQARPFRNLLSQARGMQRATHLCLTGARYCAGIEALPDERLRDEAPKPRS